MRLDKLLAQEKISRKAMKQALLKKEILVDGLPASSLAQNVDTGLQELILKKSVEFAKIADQLSQTNPANDLLNDIESYLQVFRNRSLPKTREEFETRATLLQLLRELENFIQLKVDFYQRYSEEKSNLSS